jgi:hypothetical protein
MTEEQRIRILRQIEKMDGTDAFATKGKAPVMNERAWGGLKPLADEGLVLLDESEFPVWEADGSHVLGRGFVSLTEAGRGALAQSST